jgi:hypothetical protein
VAACAAVVVVGTVDQLAPAGQILLLQVGSLKLQMSVVDPHPSKQLHFLVEDENVPCPLQLFNQSVF